MGVSWKQLMSKAKSYGITANLMSEVPRIPRGFKSRSYGHLCIIAVPPPFALRLHGTTPAL